MEEEEEKADIKPYSFENPVSLRLRLSLRLSNTTFSSPKDTLVNLVSFQKKKSENRRMRLKKRKREARRERRRRRASDGP